MKPKSDLFYLIRSMSSAEKKHFKKFSVQGEGPGKKNYVRLFDFINQMEDYDESLIRKHFAGEALLRNLTSEKRYLFGMILRSLRDQHRDRSFREQIRNLIYDAEILLERRLFDAFWQTLSKAKKLAQPFFISASLIQINLLERRYYRANSKVEPGYFPDELHRELEQLMEITQEKFWVDAKVDAIYARLWEGKPAGELSELKSVLIEKINAASDTLPFILPHAYLNCLSMLYVLEDDPWNCLKYMRELVEHWKRSPFLQKQHPLLYHSILFNYLNTATMVYYFDDFEEVLVQIRRVNLKNKSQKRIQNLHLYYLQTMYIYYTGQYERARELAEDLEGRLADRESNWQARQKLALVHLMAQLQFKNGDLSASRKWIRLFLDDPEIEDRADGIPFMHVLEIIIFWERGEYEWVLSAARSVQRRFRDKTGFHKAESIALSALTRLARLPDEHAQRETFTDLLTGIEQLEKYSNKDNLDGLLFYWLWAQSHLHRCSMQTIFHRHRDRILQWSRERKP